jgi:hypothetical protein
MLAANQNQTNRLMLGGITDLYSGNPSLRIAGSSTWAPAAALPDVTFSEEDEEELKQLAVKCEEIGQQIIAPENAVKVLPEGRPPDQHVYDHALVIHIQRMRHFGLDQTQITGVQDRFVFAHLMDAVPLQHENISKKL